MSHRKWKEMKQQPSMLPGPAEPGCCFISFHFRWAIHPIRPVHVRFPSLARSHCSKDRYARLSDEMPVPGRGAMVSEMCSVAVASASVEPSSGSSVAAQSKWAAKVERSTGALLLGICMRTTTEATNLIKEKAKKLSSPLFFEEQCLSDYVGDRKNIPRFLEYKKYPTLVTR